MRLNLFALSVSLLAVAPVTVKAASLSKDDVTRVLAQAVSRAAQIDPNAVIAVTDREGYVLGVWDVNGGTAPNPQVIAGAVSRAGTAAFLSSNQEAFTSRTAGFIVQQHFPPLVVNTAPGPLVGVGLSNIYLSPDAPQRVGMHSDVNFLKQIPLDATDTFDPNTYFAGEVGATLAVSPGTFGAGIRKNAAGAIAKGTGISGTSLNDTPGGVPLYKDGELVGAIGVTGDGSPINISTGFAIIEGKTQSNATPGFKLGGDIDEQVALAGQVGYEPSSDILATKVLINGIRLPYADMQVYLPPVNPLGSIGKVVAAFPVQASPPPFQYKEGTIGGLSGQIRFDFRNDPFPGTINGAQRLQAGDVRQIITRAAKRAAITRAGIRLPLGSMAQVFICVVGNPNTPGAKPPILGVFRTGDATIFSWDVAVQKARTAIFFSTNNFAQSTRTVGFLAQRYYPPGLDGRPPGPYFGWQETLLYDDFITATTGQAYHNPALPNGITVFPGGIPLYRNGQLVGAIGVSGDGVDQDDIIAASGCGNFAPATNIRADQFIYRGARLPFVKFPRDPIQ